jgi:signal transduction histidine kinase
MLCEVRSRRAWIYVLSVLALLVPAGGIAYLGAVSYRDEKGAVSAQNERQRQAALAIAARIDKAIADALDALDRGHDAPPLARFAFSIDADGRLRTPRPLAAVGPQPALDESHSACSGRLEDCVRALSTRQGRIAKLRAAERAEACTGDACAASLGDARRLYAQLAVDDEVAQLGLARVYRRLGDRERADAALDELDHRYADRSVDGVPVKLVAATLRAETAGPSALLDVADAVLADRYRVDPVVELGVVTRLRAQLPAELPAPLAARRAAIDERTAALRGEARAAAGLADDVAELARTAGATWRGRPDAHQPERTLIYRRRADGGITGFAVDATMLEEAAGHDDGDDVAANVRPIVLPAGAQPPTSLRPLAQGVPISEALPHLALALVNPERDPDPLDEVIRARSRRHVALTSVLALALGLGLLATIRGAARARELAQLKSDFVSTVSHELKTPLTSIRMFAEMLDQGVAQGDADKMRRYHSVIIQESQRLGLLIANLLDYAQIERGTRRYVPGRELVGPLAKHAVTLFESLTEAATRNQVAVDVSAEAMAAEVLVDRDVVVQAVLNLLANARKYGGPDKAIEVDVGADELAAWIAVRDHGPGIPAHEQARIFREFYRSPEAYRSGVEGTGLGLALVKRHVEALGGTVEVDSQPGHGARFTIRLPRATNGEAT